MDLFLLDIKAGDEQLYYLVTSAELAPTLRFARRLSDRGNSMWVRYVLVPGLTDAADDVEKVARFTSTLAHVERVEVLPFHQLGASKWADLKLPYQLADVLPRAGAGTPGGGPVPGPWADRRLNCSTSLRGVPVLLVNTTTATGAQTRRPSRARLTGGSSVGCQAQQIGDMHRPHPRLPPVRAEDVVHVMRPGGIRDQASGAGLPSDAVLVEIDRYRQGFQRRSGVQ